MICASLCLALAVAAADTGNVSLAPSPADPAASASATTPQPRIFLPGVAWEPYAPDPLPMPERVGVPTAATSAADPDPMVEYSDAYFTRLTIHRYASYATLPLFVAQYLAGEQLMKNGSDAPAWARHSHGPLAGGVAALFAVNTVTGGWNLWEGRHDPEGRTRRMLHGALMLAADAGFAATGMLADRAEGNADDRELHRTVAISSMGVSLLSYAIMLPMFGNR